MTARALKQRANELSTVAGFTATKNWLDKFKQRYGITLAKEAKSSSETYETFSGDEEESDIADSDYEEDDLVAVAGGSDDFDLQPSDEDITTKVKTEWSKKGP